MSRWLRNSVLIWSKQRDLNLSDETLQTLGRRLKSDLLHATFQTNAANVVYPQQEALAKRATALAAMRRRRLLALGALNDGGTLSTGKC
jgi:hypothetical protein